jgi:hypothetical protein
MPKLLEGDTLLKFPNRLLRFEQKIQHILHENVVAHDRQNTF